MGKETVGLKLESDIAAKFKEHQKEHGSAQEYVEALIIAYVEKQAETDTGSPVHKEKVRVKKSLADIERVMVSFLELAADDKAKFRQEAEKKITAAQAEAADLKEVGQGLADTIKNLNQKNADLEKQVEEMHDAAENIKALKEAWETEKGNLTTHIAELDSEVQEARKLKSQVLDLEKTIGGNDKTISDLQGQSALAEQQHKNDQEIIASLKSQLAEAKGTQTKAQKKLDQALADLQSTREALSAEKLAGKDRELELQQSHAGEKEKMMTKISTLEKELTALPPALEKIVGLEKDLSMATEENGKLKIK